MNEEYIKHCIGMCGSLLEEEWGVCEDMKKV